MKPTALDEGYQIILANGPSYKKIMCSHNNNILIRIPSHPYELMNRSILCNSNLEAESNFLLESLAACENSGTKIDLEMYFTVDLAFVNYFDKAIAELGIPVLRNWKTQEQVLPFSVETLKHLANQYKNKEKILKSKRQK